MSKFIIGKRGRYYFAPMGVHRAYALPGGKICLRSQAMGWKHFSGILIVTRWGVLWLYFRRGCDV